MAERLIIRLPDAPDGDQSPVDWLVLDEHDNRFGAIQSDSLDALAPLAAGRRVVVLVPGQHVTLVSAKLPSQNAQKVAQALPFALEERLAEDVGQLHFALGPADAGGTRGAAVVRRGVMDDWLERLTQAGLHADVVLPDTLMLPAADNQWHIAVEERNVLVRTGTLGGFGSDSSLAETVIALKLEQLDSTALPDAIVIQAANASGPPATTLAEVCANAGPQVAAIKELPDGTALSLAGKGLSAAGSFNLLQGSYRPRRDWERRWRRWRLAVSLAAALLIVALAWQGVDYYRMHQHAARLDAAIATVFHRAMPDARVTGDLRGRLQSRLQQLRGATNANPDNGLLAMLDALGGAVDSETRLGALSWHNRTLELEVMAKNVQALDKLRDRIEDQTGFDVQIESASAKGKHVDGRLRIEGRA